MKFLLDTQCWLWMQTAPERFRADVLEELQRPDNDFLLSAASAWEIAIKYALGKLPLPRPPYDYVPARMVSSGVLPLPVSHQHALQVATLPAHHGDPFDRLLIAQAQVEGLSILTSDPQFSSYAVDIHWAC